MFDIADKELSNMKDEICPSNMLKNNEWARRIFETWQTWRTERNKQFPEDKCPDIVFENKDTACE